MHSPKRATHDLSFFHPVVCEKLNAGLKASRKFLAAWIDRPACLIAFMAPLLISGCGGGDDNGSPPPAPAPIPAPVQAASLARTDIAQTLVQSATDAKLMIAQGKPFVIRAYFAVPTGSARPSRFYAVVSNTANPSGTEVDLACPDTLPASYPSLLPVSATGVDAAPCSVRIGGDSRGAAWSAPGLKIVLRASGNDGTPAMMPVSYDVAAKVLTMRLVLPLCPRIITDVNGDGLSVESVSNRLELKAAILNYFPFADIKYCPDAFTVLNVRDLNLIGSPTVPTGTYQELDGAQDAVRAALEQARRARTDGYGQYLHIALLLAKDSRSANFDSRKPVHGLAGLGGMSAVVYAPRDMAGGPRYYFQYQLTFLHELGHLLGLAHAPGCGADSYDSSFTNTDGVLPTDATDTAVRPVGMPHTIPMVPLRGTIGSTHGYQLYDLSNRLSVGYSGIALQSKAGTLYDASHRLVPGPGAGEIPAFRFTEATRNQTQVYDLMNYCNSFQHFKWIADYSYFRVANLSVLRTRADGSFDDLSGRLSF